MGDEERIDDIDDEDVASDAGSEPGSGGGSSDASKIIKILIYVVVLALGVVLMIGISYTVSKYATTKKSLNEQDMVVAPPPPPYARFELPSFSVTTSDEEPHFAKITIHLAYEDNIELNTELVRRTAQIQDVINVILRGKAYRDLKTIEGSLELKDNIKAHINSVLISGKIKEIYFTEFVVN
jgi:flagellar FliL protein